MRHLSGFPILVLGAVVFVDFTIGASAAPAQDGTWRVSVDASGVEGDGHSFFGLLSSDARFVGFTSAATNLVPGDTNGSYDVIVLDRQAGTLERVSVDSAGAEGDNNSGCIAISPDARYVAFNSYATNLVAGDTNGDGDGFIRDRQTGITERVTVDSAGSEGNGASVVTSISADGRYVVFWSLASNLVPGDTNGFTDVFLRDRQSGTTQCLSVDSSGTVGDNYSYTASISADGQFVAFYSWAHLVPGDKNKKSDIYVFDRQAGTKKRISMDWTGTRGANGNCSDPVISADGRFVAYSSIASNLVPADTNGVGDVFVHDLQTATTERVSIDSSGNQGDLDSYNSSISADGRFVAFSSSASNLVAGDTNDEIDVFRHDRDTSVTERVSVSSLGAETAFASLGASISPDGRFVSFYGVDASLVPGDTNGWEDVFLHGPFLTLDADPPAVGPGATLTLTTNWGLPFGAALLAVTGLDGTPMFLPVTFGTFDAVGTWTLVSTVPSGLSGHFVNLISYGLVPNTSAKRSNEVVVTFQ